MLKMNIPNNLDRQSSDALEAYNVFRQGKNLFFILLLLGLLIIQTCFWVVDQGLIDSVMPNGENTNMTYMRAPENSGRAVFIKAAEVKATEVKAADDVVPEYEVSPSSRARLISGFIEGSLSAWNFMVIFVSVLYCLSLLMGVKISLAGGLGGLADLTRAFFLSLVFMVMVIPWWQGLLELDTNLVIFNYEQLIEAYRNKGSQIDLIFYYGRFTGFWFLGLLFLVVAQSKGHRASRSIILRLSKNIEPPAPADAGLVDM